MYNWKRIQEKKYYDIIWWQKKNIGQKKTKKKESQSHKLLMMHKSRNHFQDTMKAVSNVFVNKVSHIYKNIFK